MELEKQKIEYEVMKQQAIDDQDQIELRSEKVRNLIGQMPPFLIRWGNSILIVVFIMLLLVYLWFC